MDMLPGKGEVMIQMIVSLYRAIIGVLFVVGLVATFALAAQGGAGLIMGLGIVLFMVMALGISAVLLSINDHLAAARPTSVSEASYSTEMRPTNWKAIGGFGALARSEEHTSELQSLVRISYAVFCLNKKNKIG